MSVRKGVGSRLMAASRATVAILLVAGCGPVVSTRAQFDPGVDFARLKTYEWLAEGGSQAPAGQAPAVGAVTLRRIRSEVEATLAAKGFKRAEPADFLVGVRVGERDRLRTTYWGRDPFQDERLPGRAWAPFSERRSVQVRSESVLAIDVYDARDETPIWSGFGATSTAFGEDDGETVRKLVSGILAEFPPGS